MFQNKWWSVALIVSVAINLALAGYIGGRLSAGGPSAGPLDPAAGMFSRAQHLLPPERQQALGPLLREHWHRLRPGIQRLRGAQDRINTALTAEPYRADALEQALAEFRKALLESQEASHHGLVRLAASLNARERALLLRSMRGPPGRFGPGHSPGHGPGPGDRPDAGGGGYGW